MVNYQKISVEVDSTFVYVGLYKVLLLKLFPIKRMYTTSNVKSSQPFQKTWLLPKSHHSGMATLLPSDV
jgi:hypothetical protein